MTNYSPLYSFTLVYPSKVAHASVRASSGNTMQIFEFIGKITGLNESECGQIGVTHITSALE